MTLQLTDEETEAWRRAAEAEGVSMQEFARAAIQERATRWAVEREAFLRDFVAKNKSLLDRLAE
ncbi:MAG: CopG family transcriptional regulator [Mycobacteriales bacterium]